MAQQSSNEDPTTGTTDEKETFELLNEVDTEETLDLKPEKKESKEDASESGRRRGAGRD